MAAKSIWNWQQADWPHFTYQTAGLKPLEDKFLVQSGVLTGTIRQVKAEDSQQFTVELLGDEALYTSEIEGEFLNRDSLQSSIRRNFGLATDNRRVSAAEQGIAQMMVGLYRQFDAPLSDGLLFQWHELLMNGRRDLQHVGGYRTDDQPMQVVSGPLHAPKVHFEAPPSNLVRSEMRRFMDWYVETGPTGKTPLPILARAGIAHLYFESIHPFEDGNGRIGRAIAEKVISEGLGQPVLIALSQTINGTRKRYYQMLEQSSRSNEITGWLVYFAGILLDAQVRAQSMVDFILEKARFFDRYHAQFNERQGKVIARMMREGPEGFKGGLSAENYIAITGTSRATATRDLQELVAMKALRHTGQLKGTRYHLPITRA